MSSRIASCTPPRRWYLLAWDADRGDWQEGWEYRIN